MDFYCQDCAMIIATSIEKHLVMNKTHIIVSVWTYKEEYKDGN